MEKIVVEKRYAPDHVERFAQIAIAGLGSHRFVVIEETDLLAALGGKEETK